MDQSNVTFIRMNTGEDLISEITEMKLPDGSMTYTLHNPMKVLYLTGQKPGYMSISLSQWVFSKISTVQEFIIYPNDVVTMGIPTDRMIEYYWDCVDHFGGGGPKEAQSSTEQEDLMEDVIEEAGEPPVGDSESLELLKELLQNLSGGGKKTLH